MSINLRGRQIEGIVTDAAGNIVPNAAIVIKQECPTGTFTVDVATTGGDGYFVSQPLKNGVYDLYESGTRLERVYHSAQPTQLAVYAPYNSNVPSALPTFASYLGIQPTAGVTANINSFITYLQLEPESIDVPGYGNTFPIWNANPVDNTNIMSGHPFVNMPQIHPGLSANSNLTLTRFDVEYFQPLVRNINSYRKIRWSGIPGIRFSQSSKIVLGLDYYGIVPRAKYFRQPQVGTSITAAVSADPSTLRLTVNSTTFAAFLTNVKYGDIVRVKFANGKMFWGIYYVNITAGTDPSTTALGLRWWKSSNNSHSVQGVVSASSIAVYTVVDVTVYQGMYQGIENLNESVGERFFVVENMQAQDLFEKVDSTLPTPVVTQSQEVFNYNNV